MSRWLLGNAMLLLAACGSGPAPVALSRGPVARGTAPGASAIPVLEPSPASTPAAERPRLAQPEAPPELRETASLLADVCQLGSLPKAEGEPPEQGGPRFGCLCCAPFEGCAPGEAPEEPQDSVFWPNWTLSGSFTRAGAEQRIMAMFGCEMHPGHYGGLLLLTRQGATFVMERYYSGIYPSECRAFHRKDGRDLLLCRQQDGHFGISVEAIVQWNLPDGVSAAAGEALLELEDYSPSGCSSELHASIASRRIRQLDYVQVAGHTELVIDVDVRQGPVTTEYQKRCDEENRALEAGAKPDPARAPLNLLPLRKERHRFRFDGSRFVRR